MKIVYEEALRDYMERKGYHCIAVEAINPKGCCADMTELHTRFVRDRDVEALRAKACAVHEAPIGQLLFLTRGLECDDEVVLGLRSFFGVKDITAKGLAPWKL